MEKVKVSIKGAGSLEVIRGDSPKDIYTAIRELFISKEVTHREIKRGPKKRVVAADEGSEAVPAE